MDNLPELFDLTSRVAVVTGGAGLLGAEFCRTLGEAGAHIVIADIDEAAGQKLAASLNNHLFNGQDVSGEPQQRVIAVQTDVSSKESVQQMVEKTQAQFDRLDILVNGAALDPKFGLSGKQKDGEGEDAPGIVDLPAMNFEDYPLDIWNQALEVILTGLFLCCQAVIPFMKRQGSGRIVSIASSAGKTGGTLAGAHYSVSKAGIICLAKQLARELGPHGITVNAIAPGRIDTPMIHIASDEENEAFRLRTPLGRLGTAEDVAHAAVFLASDEASFITGEILDVNGGLLID